MLVCLPGSIVIILLVLKNQIQNGIIKVAKTVGIHDFILKFPDGYDTDINWRIGKFYLEEKTENWHLLELLYNEPAFFLDEPNSALDTMEKRH